MYLIPHKLRTAVLVGCLFCQFSNARKSTVTVRDRMLVAPNFRFLSLNDGNECNYWASKIKK